MGKTLFRHVTDQLTDVASPGERAAIARILLEKLMGLSFAKACLLTSDELTPDELSGIQQCVERLQASEPIQYIVEEAEFAGHRFHVGPGVLIPRPETEKLVDLAIHAARDMTNPVIIDAGTGSGCIAISLSLALPCAKVYAFDISETALAYAKENAKRLKANVDFFKADILSDSLPEFKDIDILISNPPYVMNSEKATMHPRVKDHEPELALFVPDNYPLVHYISLARWGKRILKPDSLFMVETGSNLTSETQQLFVEEGYRQVRIIQDQFDKPRIIQCRK